MSNWDSTSLDGTRATGTHGMCPAERYFSEVWPSPPEARDPEDPRAYRIPEKDFSSSVDPLTLNYHLYMCACMRAPYDCDLLLYAQRKAVGIAAVCVCVFYLVGRQCHTLQRRVVQGGPLYRL